jgi:hypothetical protein
MTDPDPMGPQRQAFWSALADAAPELGIDPGPGWERQVPIGGRGDMVVKLSLSQDKASVYLVPTSATGERFITHNIEALSKRLTNNPAEAAQGRWFRDDNKNACYTVKRQWPEAIRWLRAKHLKFDRVIHDAGETE